MERVCRVLFKSGKVPPAADGLVPFAFTWTCANKKEKRETCSVYLLMKSCTVVWLLDYYKRTCRTPHGSYVSILAYISVLRERDWCASCRRNLVKYTTRIYLWPDSHRAVYQDCYADVTSAYISITCRIWYLPLMHRLEQMKMAGRHHWRPEYVVASIAGSHNYPKVQIPSVPLESTLIHSAFFWQQRRIQNGNGPFLHLGPWAILIITRRASREQ